MITGVVGFFLVRAIVFLVKNRLSRMLNSSLTQTISCGEIPAFFHSQFHTITLGTSFTQDILAP